MECNQNDLGNLLVDHQKHFSQDKGTQGTAFYLLKDSMA
jgi:hypothetical protein